MARSIALPSVDTVAANLRAVRASATDEQVREGNGWYPTMGGMILAMRDASGDLGMTDAHAVGIFAAFSQNATWKANVTMAGNYMHGVRRGMKRVLAECDLLADGADPTDAAILGLKRADFCANLLGNMGPVTCDRWHLRAAFATDDAPTLKPAIHALVTEATQLVAAEYGETPAACQAVIWCAVRGDGK